MMNNFSISGGIFFALLSEIRITNKRTSRMDTYKASVDKTCDNTSLLQNLALIIDTKYYKSITKKTASNYKKCYGQGGLGFQSVKCHKEFDNQIISNYMLLLDRTKIMLQKCIINEHEKRELFVKKMYWFLFNSNSLLNSKFHYLENAYSKTEFLNIKNYDFPAFVLAVWNTLIVNTSNNHIGADAFNFFFQYSKSDTEFFFNNNLIGRLRNDITAINTLSPKENIIIIEPKSDKIKKESQPKLEETQKKVIDDNEVNKLPNNTTKVINQRIININDKGKYFENIETLIIKDED